VARARSWVGAPAWLLGGRAAEVDALDAELARFERFLDLDDRAQETWVPQGVALAGPAGTAAGPMQASSRGPDPGEAIPSLLEAVSIYGALEQDDWSDQLEAGLLEPGQVAQVRRVLYQEFLWLADDLERRRVDHRSGHNMSPREAARQALVYLRQAEVAARPLFSSPTPAFYQVRARCRQARGEQGAACQDLKLAGQAPRAIGLDHYLPAVAALQAGNRAAAVEQLEAALRVEPTHYWALLVLVSCHNVLGRHRQDFELAKTAATGCILKRPHHVSGYLGRGNALSNLERFKEAEVDYRQAVRLQPSFALTHNNLGTALARQGKLAEAVAEFREALRLDPHHPLARNNLAAALDEQGKHAESEVVSREVLRLRAGDWGALINLGNALGHQGKHAEAAAVCWEALALQPRDPNTLYNLSVALNHLGKHAAAETACRKALRLLPDQPRTLSNLGTALNGQGRNAEAAVEFRKALRLQPDDPLTHCNLGIVLAAQGKHVEAEKAFREALHRQPDNAQAHFELGNTLAALGKQAGAEKAFRATLRLRPRYPEAHVNLGIALNEQGKKTEAVKEYQEALRLRPDLPEAHCCLGKALNGLGKHAGAEAASRQAVRLLPNRPEPYYNLVAALYAQRKLAEAEKECRTALHLRPDDATWHFTLGNLLRDRGNLALAAAAFRQTVCLCPEMPEGHCNLGQVLRRQGRFTEALAALRHGHQLGSRQPNWRYPSGEWVRQAEQLVALDARLSRVLEGQASPADASERLLLAWLCQEHRKRYAAAARFYAEAFAAEPLRRDARYTAACVAALAGCGQGEDAAGLTEAERAHWRRQALDWLRADLKVWGQLLQKQPDRARLAVQQTMMHWHQDADLAGVRGDALAKLPEAERQAWGQLWVEIERTFTRAGGKIVRQQESARLP
jgi:Flp pilus assembly protein TadD